MGKIQKKWIAIGAAALAVAVLGVILWKALPSGKSIHGNSFKITPNQQDEQGVLPDSVFSIETDTKATEESLRAALRIEPSIEYTLTGKGQQWNLTPTTPLSENMIYRFVVQDESGKQSQSFAFQIKGDLMISQIYPQKGEEYVDIKTSIELVFNALDLQKAEEFITIEPAVTGKWENKGYSLTFIPDKPLDEKTIYRITAKAGLTAANGMTLKEDQVYSFTTNSQKSNDEYNNLRLNGNYVETFLPGDLLVMELNGSDERHKDIAYQINVHKYPDITAFIDEVKKRDSFYRDYYGPKQDYRADTSSLEEVYSASNPLFSKGNYSWLQYALLSSDLSEGYYIVTLIGKDSQGVDQFVQKQIAIGNISTYVQSTNGNSTVWLNDPVTGKAKANTPFQLQDTISGEVVTGTTDEKGIGLVTTPKMKEGYLSVLNGDTPVSFEKVSLASQHKTALNEQYFSAIYTDREIYQPDDTIHFWGVLRPRGDAVLPSKVTVTLGDSGYDGNNTSLYQQEVVVLADGTFTGELKFTGLSRSYYQFSVQDGAQTKFDKESRTNLNAYCSKSLSVSKFVKPAYTIEVTTDKEWYYKNSKITMNISAKYFDGTPVSGGKLEISGITQTELTLDKDGKQSYTFDYTSSYEDSNWTPYTEYYYISSADAQDVTVSTSGSILIVPSKIAAKFETDEMDESKLTVTTAHLDESKILENGVATYRIGIGNQMFDHYAGTAIDIPVKVIVNKVERILTQTGSYYDPINKEIIPQYKTDIEESVVDELTATTVNGVKTWENLPYVDTDMITYWYEVEFDSQVDGIVTEREDFYAYTMLYQDETRFSFEAPDTPYEKMKRKVNDQVELDLYSNGIKEENKGTILYSILQKDSLQTDTTTEDTITFPYIEEYIPNIQVVGAYFDGRHIYEIDMSQYHYDYSERTLTLDIDTDAESYQPSSEATVSLTLTDKDGKPIAGSAIIGVVDEAIFAIEEQNLDLPSQLYQTITSTNVARSASYQEYKLEALADLGDGRGGGGGNDVVRTEFLDTAAFQTVAIDASGKATVKVSLPDNITSWRITAAAISEDNQAGSNTENTIVTLPYYIRPIVSDQYLDGDDLTISVISIGTNQKAGDTADYTAKLLAADGTLIQEQAVSAGVDSVGIIRFGKQPIGEYSIEITGVSNGNTDSVKETCSVIAEGLTSEFMKTMSIEELSQASSLRYPVQVTAYDKRLKPYMEGLESLKGQNGQRTEFLVSSYLSQVLYNQLLPEDQQMNVKKDTRLDKIQTENGGIRQLPLGTDHIETTVKMLLTAPELIQKTTAVNFLKKQQVEYSVPSDDRVLILAGLAAVNEPVLLDIKRVVAEDDLTNIQKLYLAAGLAKAGDYSGAKDIYDTITQKTTKGNQIFFKAETEDETLATTATALMATSLMNHPDADGLMIWVTEQNQTIPVGRKVLVNLEMLSYIQAYPNSDTGRLVEKSPAKFTYTANGETVTNELGQNGTLSILMNAEDFASGGFKASSGDVETILRYTDYAFATPSEEGDMVAVTKTITPIDGDGLQLGRRAKVEITLNFQNDAPSGCYDVEDYIPSGMRYVENMYNTPYLENVEAYSNNEGQRVYGNVYWTNPNELPSIGGDGGAVPYDSEPMPYAEEVESEPVPDDAEASTIPLSEPVIGLSEEEIQIRAARAKPYTYTFVYYVSCTLPGEYIVEPAYISNESENIYATASSSPITIQE